MRNCRHWVQTALHIPLSCHFSHSNPSPHSQFPTNSTLTNKRYSIQAINLHVDTTSMPSQAPGWKTPHETMPSLAKSLTTPRLALRICEVHQRCFRYIRKPTTSTITTEELLSWTSPFPDCSPTHKPSTVLSASRLRLVIRAFILLSSSRTRSLLQRSKQKCPTSYTKPKI